ncbi:transposase [Streptomyces chlorus]|uniref:Transposase n=1 Tax=Streptomyces chlorus TaxID=887452 RepID=A0ABW1E0P5_9ACTN
MLTVPCRPLIRRLLHDWSGDLTEAEWRRLKPLLPAGINRCGRWRDHRQVVDGILHRVRTGVQWRDPASSRDGLRSGRRGS